MESPLNMVFIKCFHYGLSRFFLGFGCMLHGSYFLMNSWRHMTSLVWRFGSSTVDKVIDSQVSCIVAPSLCVCRYGREQIAEFKVYTVMRSVRIPSIMWQWCFFLGVFNLHISEAQTSWSHGMVLQVRRTSSQLGSHLDLPHRDGSSFRLSS